MSDNKRRNRDTRQSLFDIFHSHKNDVDRIIDAGKNGNLDYEDVMILYLYFIFCILKLIYKCFYLIGRGDRLW